MSGSKYSQNRDSFDSGSLRRIVVGLSPGRGSRVRPRLWRLTPVDGNDSPNWRRTVYHGEEGAVIVRAFSAEEARSLASAALDCDHPTLGGTLPSPWATETDTAIEEFEDPQYGDGQYPEVLFPKVRRS